MQSRASFAQSRQRRFSRSLHNSRINAQRLYAPIIQTALKQWGCQSMMLILDTTVLWNEFCLVRVCVEYWGRAVPLGWQVLAHPSSSVSFELYRPLPGLGEAVLLQGLNITKTDPYGLVNLALARDLVSGELWYIISDQTTSLQTFREYGKRFDVEENFLGDKSNSFELERSELRSTMALSRLCLVLTIATLYLTVQGQQVIATGKRRWVDCHWERGNSYLRIGWEWVLEALHQGWKLFHSLQLSGQPDPEPARASRKQLQKQFLWEFTLKSYSYTV